MPTVKTYFVATDTLRDGINAVLAGDGWTPPATWYAAIGVYSAGSLIEPTNGGYNRQSFTWSVTGLEASNTDEILWDAATDDYDTPITHLALMDASTAGDALFVAELAVAVNVLDGQRWKIIAGELKAGVDGIEPYTNCDHRTTAGYLWDDYTIDRAVGSATDYVAVTGGRTKLTRHLFLGETWSISPYVGVTIFQTVQDLGLFVEPQPEPDIDYDEGDPTDPPPGNYALRRPPDPDYTRQAVAFETPFDAGDGSRERITDAPTDWGTPEGLFGGESGIYTGPDLYPTAWQGSLALYDTSDTDAQPVGGFGDGLTAWLPADFPALWPEGLIKLYTR
jgi:hypothetical protein